LLVACTALALNGLAHAQVPGLHAPPGPDPQLEEQQKEQARLLFSEGLQFVEQGDWANAESRFRSVLMLRASHVVAYNLASALTHLGRVKEASELLRAIVRDGTSDASTRAAAGQLLAETEQRIGTLTLRVAGDATGASVQLDGAPLELGEQILTISVDPGEHHVEVLRDGLAVARQTVLIGGDAPLQVSVTLTLPPRIVPVAVAKAAQPATGAERDRSAGAHTDADPARDSDGESIFESWWLWTAVGAVAAGGAVAGVLLASGGADEPVRGDTDPPLLRGTVKATMP
jgi:tetratricopeptide (TPR) repeat protein